MKNRFPVRLDFLRHFSRMREQETVGSLMVTGESAVFLCSVVSGLGEVTITWTFNNTDITHLDLFTNRTNILRFGAELVITDLQPDHSGVIGCQASNNQSLSVHRAELLVTHTQDREDSNAGSTVALVRPRGVLGARHRACG